jgi:hypothetical protein
MTKAGFWLNATIASLGCAGFVIATAFFGYKWLAHDEANRSYACGSGSRGGTCFTGETTNMVMTFVFGAVAIAGLVLTVQAFRARGRSPRESN